MGPGDLLEAMPPFITGGSMIETVRMEGSTYAAPPQRFEAGSPNAMQAVGLGAAIDYLDALGMDRVAAHDHLLTEALLTGLAQRPWVRLGGSGRHQGPGRGVSFVVDGVHAHDVGQVLDDEGIAVRVGHHCAWPLHRRFRATATARASFAAYNTLEEVEAMLTALDRVPEVFGTTVEWPADGPLPGAHPRALEATAARGLREPFEAEVHHVNPTCGDEVTLRVHLEGEGRGAVVRDISYDTLGCSISTASTSVLAEEVIGHTVDEALRTHEAMRAMLTSKGADPGDEEVIGDGVALGRRREVPRAREVRPPGMDGLHRRVEPHRT